MFTGIVEELGTVLALDTLEADGRTDSARLTVAGPLVTADATHGASISVNGVCLTVLTHGDGEFTVDVMAQTLALTSLGALRPGDRVNLERAMAADGRFGGHVVQGHVDVEAARGGDHTGNGGQAFETAGDAVGHQPAEQERRQVRKDLHLT